MIRSWTDAGSDSVKLKNPDSSRSDTEMDHLPVPLRLRARIDSFVSLVPWLDSLREIDLNSVKSDDLRFNSLLKALRASPGIAFRLRRLCTPFAITEASLGPLHESIQAFPKFRHLHIGGMRATAEQIAKGLLQILGQLTVLELGSALTHADFDGAQFLVRVRTMPKLRRFRFDAPICFRTLSDVGEYRSAMPPFSPFLLANYPRLAQLESASVVEIDRQVWTMPPLWRLPQFRLPGAKSTALKINGEQLSMSGLEILRRITDLGSLEIHTEADSILSSLTSLERLVVIGGDVLFPISVISGFKLLRRPPQGSFAGVLSGS